MSTVRADLRRYWRRSARYRPATATGWVVAITVAAYVVQLLTQPALEDALSYRPTPSATLAEPWTLLTTALIHQPIGLGGSLIGIAHIGFNMYALLLFGRPLEGVIGRWRFLTVYVLSVLAGSIGVLYYALLLPNDAPGLVYGASGGVFGVLGAVAAVQRRLGVDVRALVLTIAVNFAIPFFVGNIAWQAHLGGLIVGVLVGWLFVANRGPRRDARARTGAGIAAVVLLVLAFVPALVLT